MPVVTLRPKHGVIVVVAEPKPSRHAASGCRPTMEEVSDVNLVYERTLVAVFDEYKAACGEPVAQLVIK